MFDPNTANQCRVCVCVCVLRDVVYALEHNSALEHNGLSSLSHYCHIHSPFTTSWASGFTTDWSAVFVSLPSLPTATNTQSKLTWTNTQRETHSARAHIPAADLSRYQRWLETKEGRPRKWGRRWHLRYIWAKSDPRERQENIQTVVFIDVYRAIPEWSSGKNL